MPGRTTPSATSGRHRMPGKTKTDTAKAVSAEIRVMVRQARVEKAVRHGAAVQVVLQVAIITGFRLSESSGAARRARPDCLYCTLF